jgi:transposase
MDIRERVLALVSEGLSCREAARRLRISAASAGRIIQRHRRVGSVAASRRGRPVGSGKPEGVSGFLSQQIEQTPDMTMPERADALWTQHQIRADPAELSRFLKHRLKLTYKKIPDRNGEATQTGARLAVRLAAPQTTKDAS